jgi:heme-degrading monooxygenase HmoA
MSMIARIWRGVVATGDADAYGRYIDETGFSAYQQTPGNQGAWLLRRDEDGRTEFLAFTLWESVDAIKAFAGEDIEAAVLYPEDERYLIDGASTTAHYDVADAI